jgi:hypothetical protein
MAVAASDDRFQASHPGWNVAEAGSGTTLGFPGPFGLRWIEWSASGPNQLIPRGGAQGFTVRSASAPGFTEVWARGKVDRLYEEHIAAALPGPVTDQLAHVITHSAQGRRVWTIGPWFPPDTPLATIVHNFQYGVSMLMGHRLLDSDSPFVREMQAALTGYLESGESATFFNPNTIGFLSLAAPGLETEIANALRLNLIRQ